MTDVPICFEVWASAREAPPRRSRLYRLEPIGLGTPEVESLSSYLNRLAQAHCVTVSALIAHELVPQLGTPASARAQPSCLPIPWGPARARATASAAHLRTRADRRDLGRRARSIDRAP